MTQQAPHQPQDLWPRLVESHTASSLARREFFADGVDRIEMVRAGLSLPQGNDAATAFHLLRHMKVGEQMQLFRELIHLARAAHGYFHPAWEVILSLPKDWVLARIEQEVDPILANEEETDYYMFLQLYDKLDRNLTLKLARRAASHADSQIRELGEDYLARLTEVELNGQVA